MKKIFAFFVAATASLSMMAQYACNSVLENRPGEVTGKENNDMYVIEWGNATGDLVNPNVGFSFQYKTTVLSSRTLYVDYKTATSGWTQLGDKLTNSTSWRALSDRKLPADATGVRFRYQGGIAGSCSFSSVVIPMNTYMSLDNAPNSLLGNVEVNQNWMSENVAVRYCDVQAIVAEITDFVSVNGAHTASCLTVTAVDGEVAEACGTYGNATYQVTGLFTAADSIKANLTLTTPCGKVQVVPVCVVVTDPIYTALPETKDAVRVEKVFRNGSLYIRRGEALYDMSGRKVK